MGLRPHLQGCKELIREQVMAKRAVWSIPASSVFSARYQRLVLMRSADCAQPTNLPKLPAIPAASEDPPSQHGDDVSPCPRTRASLSGLARVFPGSSASGQPVSDTRNGAALSADTSGRLKPRLYRMLFDVLRFNVFARISYEARDQERRGLVSASISSERVTVMGSRRTISW